MDQWNFWYDFVEGSGSSARASDKEYHSLTVERLRALLKERGLSPKGKKVTIGWNYLKSFNILKIGHHGAVAWGPWLADELEAGHFLISGTVSNYGPVWLRFLKQWWKMVSKKSLICFPKKPNYVWGTHISYFSLTCPHARVQSEVPDPFFFFWIVSQQFKIS